MKKANTLSEKDKIVYKNIFAAFIVKGASLIISLFMMPAYMRFFKNESVLGVWYTILSVLTWILSFDLGIGNGLRNKLSNSFASKDIQTAKEYISSAYWMIGTVVVFVSILGLALIPLCNWNALFNISEKLIGSKTLIYAVASAFIGIMLQFFLRLISAVIYALQKSAVNNFISLITSCLQLVFLLIAPNGTAEENIRMFSSAYIFFANAPLFTATIIVFAGPLKLCRPQFGCISKEKAKSVLSLGGIFFACQILYMLIANTNEFFITQYTGPENVVEYQIYHKLFTLGSMLFSLALTPIWSIVSKAIAENDMNWLRKLYKKLKILSWIGVCCEFIIIVFLQIIINVWLREDAIQVNYVHALIFALFGSSMLYQSMLSTITNGMGRMKIQACCYAVGVVAKFLIIHVGITWTGSWIIVVLANTLILLPYCFIQQMSLDRMLKY